MPRRDPHRDSKTGSARYHAFQKRLIRMYHKRAMEGELDITALEQLRELQQMLDEQTGEVVRALNAQGFSWKAIGDALGIDRSNAAKKYGKP